MADFDSTGLGNLARRILDYFTIHPEGQDTLEGIAEWWILESKLLQTLAETRKAISELESQGLVESMQQGGHIRYRLKRPGSSP